ncbi:hypothetical protein V6N13_052211 [Hibiscus sabdariffa]
MEGEDALRDGLEARNSFHFVSLNVDGEELVAVGERTVVVAENEGVGDGSVDLIGTDKVSYVNMIVRSKGLNGDVVRVPGFIEKDVETCTANTATSDAPVGGD